MTVLMGAEPNGKTLSTSEVHRQRQLLPGIPNEITLEEIAPRLSWRDLFKLSSVSHSWQQANRSRQIYDARVRSPSTEKLVLLNYVPYDNISALALLSLKDSFYRELPPIPGLRRGIPRWCQFVTMDARIYVLGGVLNSVCGGGKVFMLDLAGQGRWQQCANMREPRQMFGCCVKDGKIFAFGGRFHTKPVRGSEVYDPETNVWSPISPMPNLRFLHHVMPMPAARLSPDEVAMGNVVTDGLVVLGEKTFERECRHRPAGDLEIAYDGYDIGDGRHDTSLLSLLVYRPRDDQWTEVTKQLVFCFDLKGMTMFTSRETFFILGSTWIRMLDYEKRGWRYLHSCSFAAMGGEEGDYFEPLSVLVLEEEEELLAIVEYVHEDETSRAYLVRSKGFGSKRLMMTWHEVEFVPFAENSGLLTTSYSIFPLVL